MNRLSLDRRTAAIGCLVEGNSIRSTERMTGIHRDTVMRLLVEVGTGCAALMDEQMRELPCQRLQVDEIWTYVQKKQRQVTADDDQERVGDQWTFVALDADTKLVPTYRIGKRDLPTAKAFMGDLAGRMANRVQLSSDALAAYVEATEEAFGADVDYGQVVKIYEAEHAGAGRYSPPQVVRVEKRVSGRPRSEAHLHQPHRAAEPHHADEHAPVHAAHERFQQEGGEPAGGRGASLRALQLRAHPFEAPGHAGYGGRGVGSAMVAARFGGQDFLMFGWFGSKKRKAPFAGPFAVSMVPSLLADYGELLEKHSTEIVDTSWLPATKPIMVQAFKSAWLSTGDSELRNHIEVAWASLSSFQDGVGDMPAGCDIADLSMEETGKLLARYAEWSPLSLAEGKVLLADLIAFRVANSN